MCTITNVCILPPLHTHKIPSVQSAIPFIASVFTPTIMLDCEYMVPLNTSITLAALHIMIYVYYLSIFLSFQGEYPSETNLLFLSFISPHVLFNYPVNGLRSTRTFSQLLNIPTVGQNPPFGIFTCLKPMIFPFLVKNICKRNKEVLKYKYQQNNNANISRIIMQISVE